MSASHEHQPYSAVHWYVVDKNGGTVSCSGYESAVAKAVESQRDRPHLGPYIVSKVVAVDAAERLDGMYLIGAERARHQRHPSEGGEGWTRQHDEQEHDNGQLAAAAACYAMPPEKRSAPLMGHWPWEIRWWKPGSNTAEDRIRQLVKAGALCAAEIDRLLSIRALAKAGNER